MSGATLRFLGAAGEVTGSCFLLEHGGLKFLVDCGMFQGGRETDEKNRRFAFDPRAIDFVIVTHAHIDHSGLLPRLVSQGFRGAIHATEATCDLLRVMLPDSGHLQEKESEWRGREPLYTLQEANRSLERLVPAAYDAEVKPHAAVRCRFRQAGHILGSAIVELSVAGRKLVFSGDLGWPGRPILPPPARVEEADLLVVESTYGNRDHKSLAQTMDELAGAINDSLASRRGNVLIPSFAVGRTQDVLYAMGTLQAAGRLPATMEVYVDSPMALAATRITLKYAALPPIRTLRFTESLEESMAINAIRSGAVILSASGMCDGGRIRHHLKHNLSRPECAVVFVGFQAAGTLGRRIVDGAETVRLFGEPYPVRAKIFTINGLSAHAGRADLLGWLKGFRRPPGETWVAHGEPLAANSLRDAIERELGWPRARVPERGQAVAL